MINRYTKFFFFFFLVSNRYQLLLLQQSWEFKLEYLLVPYTQKISIVVWYKLQE